MKNYYIYEYVFDSNKGEYTDIAGEIKGFVKADDPFEACEKLGFTDAQKYFASEMHDPKEYEKLIENERKHLSKISKQLKDIVSEHEKNLKICPNCGATLNDNYVCDSCRFGHEQEDNLKELLEDCIKQKDELVKNKGSKKNIKELDKMIKKIQDELK